MNPVRKWTLRQRIMMLGGIPVVLAVLLITSYHMYHRWQELRRENATIVSVLMEQLSAAAEYPLISGNYDMLHHVASIALRQPAVMSVRIADETGVIFEDFSPRYRDVDPVDLRESVQEIVQMVPELNDFSVPGDDKFVRRYIGSVSLETTEAFIREQEMVILRQSLLTGLVVVFFSLLAAAGISTTIIPALERLAGFIARLAEDRAVELLKVEDGAEIGALQQNANRLAQALAIARDSHRAYTARLKDEQRKTQMASQAKSDFLSMMSHELRTPLNGAVGMLQLMSPGSDPVEFEDSRLTAERSLMHLTQMLEDMLVLVAADADSNLEAAEDCLLPDILEGLIRELGSRALAKRLSFIADFDECLRSHRVRVEPSFLRQLVRHVAGNAIKFTDRGYVILQFSVETGQRGRILMIRALDSGIGIPHDQKARVFDAFAQLHTSIARHYDGLGLGLTITHHIIQLLGGRLDLRDNPAGGTELQLEIPLEPGSARSLVRRDVAELPLRVLVVEDNPVNTRVIEQMLVRVCAAVRTYSALSGEACLELLAQHPAGFDLVLMDCQLPDMDGFETTVRLRRFDQVTPVVACTGDTSDQSFRQCLDIGMNDVIAKPVTVEGISQSLQNWAAPRYLALPDGLRDAPVVEH